jgi:hypothetical protein
VPEVVYRKAGAGLCGFDDVTNGRAGSVIGNENLKVGKQLPLESAEDQLKVFRLVVDRNNEREEWHGVRGLLQAQTPGMVAAHFGQWPLMSVLRSTANPDRSTSSSLQEGHDVFS